MKGATLWLLKMKKLLQKRGATSPVLDGTGASPAGDAALRGAAEEPRGDVCGAGGDGPAGAEWRKEKIGQEKEGSRGFRRQGALGAAARGAICRAGGSWRLWSGGV